MTMVQFFTLANIIVTSIMLGVILMIQWIHYPAFLWVAAHDFSVFHLQHTRVMGFIAGPLMISELALALIGLIYFQEIGKWSLILNFSLVLLLWGMTFLKSVPLHSALSLGKDLDLINQLITTNWLRTIGWILKFVVALAMVFSAFKFKG